MPKLERCTDARQIIKNIEAGQLAMSTGLKALVKLFELEPDEDSNRDKYGYTTIKAAAGHALIRIERCQHDATRAACMRNIVREEAQRCQNLVGHYEDDQRRAHKCLVDRVQASR